MAMPQSFDHRGGIALCLFALWNAIAAAQASNDSISWSPCTATQLLGLDCGTFDVPIAYEEGNSTDARGNETVSLFLTKLNSTGDAKQGYLFLNPGGPGVPASSYLAGVALLPQLSFSEDVRKEYVIIGVDPRGTGFSSPIKCDPKTWNERVPTFVNDSRGFEALKERNRRRGESCANLTGPLLDHLDSVHVAKDLDLVREALGANKFNYFGLSYGSLIGATYTSLFPGRVGRLALDGLIDHSQSEVSTLLTEATTYEATLNQFFEWCDKNSTCPLHGNNTKKSFDTLLARADARAIPAPGCNGTCRSSVTGEDIRYNVQFPLSFYDVPVGPGWVALGGYIAQALEGNATGLSSPLVTDETSVSFLGSEFVYLAIGCQDWRHRARSVTDLTQRLRAVQTFAPRTAGAGQMYYYQSACIGWPAPVTNGQSALPVRISRAPPILLVNSVYDPYSSIVWADGLRQQIPRAVSITRNGPGHISHYFLGETRDAIDTYLAKGKLPKDGTVYQT
ncbi:Tripeptidyl aminopeptidase [Paramyrothecium foliicola]|nr:Tripeptidyl aminopeptidase [Paramyrothecium foliicola]